MCRKLQRIEVANLDFIRFFSSCRPCRPQRHPNANTFFDAPGSCSRNICREKPVFAGKVTCGFRNETSGQSWPSNTVATDPFTGQNRNSKCGSGIQHKRLGGWRPKILYLTVSNASLHRDGSTWSLELLTFLANQPRQRPLCSCDGRGIGAFASNCPIAGANLDQWTGEIALPKELGALDGPVPSDVSFERQL
jgi:hypothetical protein